MLIGRVSARSWAVNSLTNGFVTQLKPEAIRLGARATALHCHVVRTPTARVASSSSSSTRWKARQAKDRFAKDAKVKGLMSRAAFKLLEINDKHRLFRPGDTVVDLGYAPGSWSQVAVSKTQPNGRVLGIDIIPAQPPRGVSTIQGDFLDPEVQAEVRACVRDYERGRPTRSPFQTQDEDEDVIRDAFTEEELKHAEKSYIDLERQANTGERVTPPTGEGYEGRTSKASIKQRDLEEGRLVNVVLSDMMMNTSGVAFRDHAGSMDLCLAALAFCFDTLRTGGHFVCKFYQGSEDKEFEKKLRQLFEKVHREKPEASRDASKEAYFIGLRRKADVQRQKVIDND